MGCVIFMLINYNSYIVKLLHLKIKTLTKEDYIITNQNYSW